MSINPELARSMLDVLSTMEHRGLKMPSHDVQRAALDIHGQNIIETTQQVKRFHVQGSQGRRYTVTLTLTRWDTGIKPHPQVIDGECTCPAGESGKMCKHLLRVLAELDRRGYKLMREKQP